MSSKFDPDALAAGLDVGNRFLRLLMESLSRHGASAHLIRFMTLQQNVMKFDEWVKFGIAQLYPVPRSLIEQLVAEVCAKKHADDSFDFPRMVLSYQTHYWTIIELEKTFGIPEIRFHHPAVPRAIQEQIVGKPFGKPHIVEHEGEPHIVVGLYSEGERDSHNNGNEPLEGFVYQDDLNDVFLAPARYFDLEN